ncbi:MAG TPA: protein translocase subunit SecD, partial [Wenzhouxiangellaceae bacterium]|nr:protein translocase subunit SecD [Wenzhouxiangellaceae bacterium]
MNRYPAWKYILLIAVVAFGIIYALPNLFGDDPAVQVSSARGFELDPALQSVAEDVAEAQEIQVKSTEFTPDRLMLRVNNSEQQLALADALREQLGDAYVVALNLAPATPDWLRAVNASPMVLGLDLQGGVHFLMEVDMDTARTQQLERFVDDIRNLLRDESIRYRSVRADREALVAELRTPEDRQTAMTQISRDLPELELETF